MPRMAFDSPNYRMADKLAGGTLDATLAELSASGLSYSAISARLFADYGIEVSAPTVGTWLKTLPIREAQAS